MGGGVITNTVPPRIEVHAAEAVSSGTQPMLRWLVLLCEVVQRGAAMKIVIYGGSITADRKIHQPNRNEFPVTPYPALLANSRPDWEVKNLGVGAAGVRINFECSLEDAVIEHNAINLQKW